MEQDWKRDLRRLAKTHRVLVLLFDDSEWDRLEQSRLGLMEFTVARARDVLEDIRTPAPCLVFRRGHGSASNDGENARFGIVASRTSVSTLEARVRVTRLRPVAPQTTDEICVLLSDPPLEQKLRDQISTAQSTLILPPTLAAKLVEKLVNVEANRLAMQLTAEVLSTPTHFNGPAATQWHALRTALRTFGLSHDEPAASIDLVTNQKTALAQLNVVEDGVVEHDARSVPGYELISSDTTGRAVFRSRGEQLVVYTANRRPLEAAFGVDLIYLNETQQNIVMLQYKMLDAEGSDWIYRPDDQLMSELDRMRPFAKDPDPEPSDYRLSPQICYLRFVKRDGALPNASITLPFDHFEKHRLDPLSRGPRGGVRISFRDLAGHYLHQQPFLDLIRSGYIGGHRATTAHLKALVDAVVGNGRAAIAAIRS